jgi:hypothetical protein
MTWQDDVDSLLPEGCNRFRHSHFCGNDNTKPVHFTPLAFGWNKVTRDTPAVATVQEALRQAF